jgi:hypothetical protein
MRSLVPLLVLVLAGCPLTSAKALTADDGSGNGSGSSGGGAPECVVDSQCVAAGTQCCDCPTFAVPSNDPTHLACAGIVCPPSSCPANVRPACDSSTCVLACVAIVCPATCTDGFTLDANNCLDCPCAAPLQRECAIDNDCARTRADCCGCARGGMDTAVPAGQVAAFDAGLMCPANPTCPDVNSCAPGLTSACVEGTCALVSGGLPLDACGRAGLLPCPNGQDCVINVDPVATAYGVGVCRPAL